jgi:hypothetical protein
LIRQVRLMRSRSVEPLGSGDLLRPWEEEAVSFAAADFNVLTPVRLAVLDRELMAGRAIFRVCSMDSPSGLSAGRDTWRYMARSTVWSAYTGG